jgi:hypothetical protein
MLKFFVIMALVAAFVLFAALVGMIAFSSEQSEADNHTKPAAAEYSGSENSKSMTDKAAADDNKQTEKKRDWYYTFIDRPTDWLLVLFNGLLVLSTIALFVSGERNVEVARKSSLAAQRSADLAEKALVAANRPWIKVDVMVGGPIVYDVNGANFSIKFILKNIGRSPASNVWVTRSNRLMSRSLTGKRKL